MVSGSSFLEVFYLKRFLKRKPAIVEFYKKKLEEQTQEPFMDLNFTIFSSYAYRGKKNPMHVNKENETYNLRGKRTLKY